MQKIQATFLILILFLAISFFVTAFEKASGSKVGIHSSELQENISTDENTETKAYTLNGVPTFAADKHYAIVVKTRNGNKVLEEYYDIDGSPVVQPRGHSALLREYDGRGREYRTTYLGTNNYPIINVLGFSSVVRAYNADGFAAYERYYDTEGLQIRRTSGYYGRHNLYHNERNTEVIFLDGNDEPVRNNSGYAILKRSFYETDPWKGKVENEFYFDESDQPVALSLGQFGVHKEYDEFGRNNVLTYLNADGQPMVTKVGYSTVKRTFYPDDTVRTEMYFDLEGCVCRQKCAAKPAKLSIDSVEIEHGFRTG